MMAHNDRSSKFESLVSHAQLEFLRSEASNPNIPSDKRFSRIGDFQIDGQYCDITLISSDKVYFKVKNFNIYNNNTL